VLTDGQAYAVTKVLKMNVQSGTGTAANYGCPAAGKTGTTDEAKDAWFVGYTPKLSAAVWVGYPDERIYMSSLYFGGPVDGGTFPAMIWSEYMGNAKGKFCGDFPPPKEPFVSVPFTGKYANSGGAAVDGDVYAPSPTFQTAPTEPTEPTTTEPSTTEPDSTTTPDTPANPDAPGTGGFDPTQYESAPQDSATGQSPPG
jgi:penicillin-binding protein 1A